VCVLLVKPSHFICKQALFTGCPKPEKIGRIAAERAFGIKWRYDGVGGTDSFDGVVSGWIVCDDCFWQRYGGGVVEQKSDHK